MIAIPFNPSLNGAPPFQAGVTLDGKAYTLVAMWNFVRGDWYVQLWDQNGNLVCNQPLIGSPPTIGIPLFPSAQFQTSTLIYLPSTGQFIQNP